MLNEEVAFKSFVKGNETTGHPTLAGIGRGGPIAQEPPARAVAPLLNLGQALLQTLKLQTNLRLHGGL